MPQRMPKATAPKSEYRKCVGIALFNSAGKVWLGKRAGATGDYTWQLPQGGMDPGERREFAALRELHEETGISVLHLKPLGRAKHWLYYDFPKDHPNHRLQKWRGQRQSWHAYRFVGRDTDVNLNMHEPAEFTEFRWADLSEISGLVIPFKRKVYEQLTREFEGFARPAN